MTILHSCCCWHSLRKGSYASAAYTFVYFSITGTMLAGFLHKEKDYLTGETTAPESYSFLEDEISKTTILLHIVLVLLSVLGMLSAILLSIGIYKVDFHPITGVLYTADFFLLCLNIYSLLCVISQYQEYKAGRGRASDDFDQSIPSLRLQYLSHHNATRNQASQPARSVYNHSNNNAETQLQNVSNDFIQNNRSKISEGECMKTGGNNAISVIGRENLQINGQTKSNNMLSSHKRTCSKMRKVKFPDDRNTPIPSEPSSVDMELHVETVCINTSEPSCVISHWNSSQLLPIADKEPLLQNSPDEHKTVLESK